jgi:hypothetical protein
MAAMHIRSREMLVIAVAVRLLKAATRPGPQRHNQRNEIVLVLPSIIEVLFCYGRVDVRLTA